jgi:pSer/pThr/pTyr-binding forkhead associated (FHA) protein
MKSLKYEEVHSIPYLLHQSGKRIPIKKQVTVGRVTGHIVIKNDDQLSSSHARFDFKDGDVYITDLNSTNGVFLNDNIISPGEMVVIPNKAEIKIGSQIFTLDFPEAEIGNASALTTIAPLKIVKSNGVQHSPQEKKKNKMTKSINSEKKIEFKRKPSRFKKIINFFSRKKK